MSKTKNFNTEKEFEESENENQSIFQNTTSLNNNINEKENDLYEEFFNYFLPNNKKTLTIKECKNAMRSIGILITEKELTEMLGLKEKTGKEKINLNNFIEICQTKKNENNHCEEIEEAFKMYDPNETGFVNSKELKHAMLIFKPKMSEDEIEQILNEFEIDEEGYINYYQYLNKRKKINE